MTQLRFPFVVIGSGPVGFAVTETLLARGHSVAVVPGGALGAGEPHQSLLEGDIDMTHSRHEPLQKNRRMGAGGTGDWWGGRAVLFDPIDFAHRPWMPNSGWPISYDEYLSYLPQAARTLDMRASVFRNATEHPEPLFQDSQSEMRNFSDTDIEAWSTATSFTKKWKKLLKSHNKLIFLDGAILTSLRLNSAGNVESIECLDGSRTFTLEGRSFILATGGLENARVMLLAGFDKHLPALGRYYMSHVWSTKFEFGNRKLAPASNLGRYHGSYVRRRWRPRDGVQAQYEIGNAIGFAGRPKKAAQSPNWCSPPEDEGSEGYRAHFFRSGSAGSTVAYRARQFVHGHRGLLPILGFGLRAVSGRRPPLLLPSDKAQRWALWFQGEHAPQRESKVTLSDSHDMFGNPRLKMRVSFSDIDFRTVEVFHTLFQQELEVIGFQSTDLGPIKTQTIGDSVRETFTSNSHHAGTTRMGINKNQSVVDANLRVHGVENLHVAGTSVFPTSGHANPTLTAVILAHRLGEHLADQHAD